MLEATPSNDVPTTADAALPDLERGVPPRLRRRRRLRWLYVADAVVILGAILLTNLARFGRFAPETYSATEYLLGDLATVCIHLIAYYFAGLYEPEERLGTQPWLPRVATQTLVAVLLIAFGALLTGRYLIPRVNLAALFVLATIGVTGNRWLARARRSHRYGRPRVLLVGTAEECDQATTHLKETDRAAIVVGSTASTERLADDVSAAGATDVLLLSPGMAAAVWPEPLGSLGRSIGILYRVTGRETALGLRAVRDIGGLPFVALGRHTLPPSRARFKRCIELLTVVVVSPIAAVGVVVGMLYVRVVAGKGVLYVQPRVGMEGRVFQMVKLRTMVRDAEEITGPVLAERDDPRVVPACRWLRTTRLDELPQLFNVLRGEMSLVGPRPERPELAARLEARMPGYSRRNEIPPGITGLAQVRGRYRTDPEYKLGLDLQYLVNWSPVLDAQIIVRTIWVVLTGRV